MKKFNPKAYQNKGRIYRTISGEPRITRIFIWNKIRKEYVDPPNGKKYLARRYEIDKHGVKKRVPKYFRDLRGAKKWRDFLGKQKSINLNKGLSEFVEVSITNTGYTFLDLFEDFKKFRFPNLREGTRELYIKNLGLLRFFFGIEIESLKPSTIDEWLGELKSEERLKTYRSNRVSFEMEIETLKSLINWYIDRNDDSKLVSPFKKRHKEMMMLKPRVVNKSKFMLPDESSLWFKTLARVAPYFHDSAITQVDCLLRVSEAYAMKWDFYDPTSGTYRVCEHVFWGRRKGIKHKIVSGTKNIAHGDSYELPLRERVVEIFEKLRKKAKCNLIFHNDGELWTYRQIQRGYDKAFIAAGLPYRSTHVCRHTGATQFLNETGDPLALQQMGHWSDLRMAMQYGKIMKERAKQAVKEADEKQRLKLVKRSICDAVSSKN